ncbi:MAG: box helicase, partial [Rhizobacter sp.]|nr:box helicase [Rhizobacter sp.]
MALPGPLLPSPESLPAADPAAWPSLEVGGETITLLPQKAAWLPERRALLIADAHIGKAMSFRMRGVPVPRGTTQETLNALSVLIERFAARQVVFLGDFLHSAHSHAASTMNTVTR